jgi:cell division protein FtsQ
VSEPRPARDGHDHVPGHVLDELRAAFGESGPEARAEVPPTSGESGESVVSIEAVEAVGSGIEVDSSLTEAIDADAAFAPTVALDAPEPVDRPDDDLAQDAAVADTAIADTATADTDTAIADTATATASSSTIIVIGGDDDLPDAMYLDEATGARDASERGTIVIGDDLDSSGAFDAVEVPSRSMDPRLRERRIAVKRARGRRRLIWVSAISAALLLVVAVVAVFASSLFAVEVVDVQGAVYTADRNGEQLQAVIDAMLGDPVLLVDTLAAEQALEDIPWVERAFVHTDFPRRVVIDIRERRPFATYQGSDRRYRVIDRDGRVLDVLEGRPVDYMVISGTGPDLEPGSLSGAPYARASQMVGALPAELRLITASVSVDPTTGELGLVLAGPVDSIEVRIGTFDGLDSKLARLLQQVRDGLDDVERIDVSSDDIVISRTPEV